MALGQEASVEVGLALNSLSVRGPFLLYMTNILGIVFAGSLGFFLAVLPAPLVSGADTGVDIRQFDHRCAALGDQYG
jgi:hypothetical protein